MGKACSCCDVYKDEKEYYADKTGKLGLQHRCKECQKRNKGKYTDNARERNRQHKMEDPLNHMYSRLKKSAKDDNKVFSIKLEDLKFSDRCPIYGTEWDLSHIRSDQTPTVDRVDNTKGYIKGNVKIISWKANRLKHTASLKEIEALAKYMKEHYKETENTISYEI